MKCGKGHEHSSVAEVRACYSVPEPTSPVAVMTKPVTWRDKEVTTSQLWKIGKLNGDKERAVKMNRGEASDYIEHLMKNPATPPPAPTPEPTPEPAWQPPPRRPATKVPIEILKMLPDGYFAGRLDSNYPYSFFRISRPTKGKFADALKVQTQHGPNYKLMLVVWPSGRTSLYDSAYEDDLMLIMADYQTALLTYAREMKHCCRCNFELTDPRSRWYGIGPECEQKPGWEWIINNQPVYVPGMERSDAV